MLSHHGRPTWQANATVTAERSSYIPNSADSSGVEFTGRLTVIACFPGKSRGKAFDSMNGIAANMLLHLTSSVRFEGPLNVDLNEITTNLVPFPRLHFLLASLSPLAAPRDVAKLAGAPRAVDQVAGSDTPLTWDALYPKHYPRHMSPKMTSNRIRTYNVYVRQPCLPLHQLTKNALSCL